ncbi:MAG: T9SS type A sorting domain-containing protein [Ignavibacteriaceae bacterium]|nr:T9SS type A sorting domain-containing protein [Ignavibacteriaceae bacterium]
MYLWDIPANLFITKSIIRIEREEYFEILAESDTFKIKPLIITKLDDNGDYISYDSTDWWGFSNDLDLWPESWWQNFDYTGIDPITNRIYSPWQGDSVFAKASSSDHPDWMSFVGAFGVNACYAFGYPGLYCSKALLLWAALKDDWKGSCFGIAISNALAFEKKADFLQAYPSFPNFTEPFLVLSDTSVIKVVNELFTHQFGNPHTLYYEKTPNETLNDLRDLLKEDKVPIRALSFCSNDPYETGGHTVVGYKIEKDTSFDFIHYIYVYDNSYPNVLDARVKINTLANFGFGSWSTQYAWQNWGGNKDIFLEDSAKTFLSKPLLPKKSKGMSLFVLSENDLQILPSTQTTPLITDSQGNQTGIGSLGMVVEIPGSYPLIKKNGNSEPPYGYSFPTDNYSVVMTNITADTIDCYLFTGSKSFLYERYGATQTQTDRLFFDGGVSVTNPDPEQKTVKLLSIISDTTSADEKLFLFRSINLSQNDSVKIINPDDNKLDLISYGSQKNYQIELNYASSTGFGRFLNTGITLSQNTTHKLVPNWGDFADLGLTIYVDEGNDGTIDDTLEIQNQATGVGEEQGSLIPTEYRLEQNYPNPFNNSTIIRYSILKEGIVTLKIYNAIGEEVTTIVNEVKQPGNYEVTFGTEKFTSGVYFYRIQAGSFVQTRKMILLK